MIDLLVSNELDIDKDAEEFVSLFVNTAGYIAEKTKKRSLLPSWYDGYFFCSWVGIKFNRRKKEWKKITKSNRGFSSRKSQYFYLIASMLSKEEILYELNIESKESIISILELEIFLIFIVLTSFFFFVSDLFFHSCEKTNSTPKVDVSLIFISLNSL